MVVSLPSTFSYFLLLKQQRPGNLYASQSPFRCMLFNHFNIYMFKECLRVRCAYTTPAFPDFNMNVYGVKHERLWG